MVNGLNVRYFLSDIQRECVPQMRERVILVGVLKSFKQKFHFPKPIKTHFFNQLVF
ncbi:hypothetical protein [Helicobacter pylori]|uniref:hypothetical protein n=1 Tax=Helicobacter pylori TaxID=210 RepID=UPI001915E2DE|nr:hypothetical protein [Helicobacter pylori]